MGAISYSLFHIQCLRFSVLPDPVFLQSIRGWQTGFSAQDKFVPFFSILFSEVGACFIFAAMLQKPKPIPKMTPIFTFKIKL